jgi:chemotaxis signal transduction protein
VEFNRNLNDLPQGADLCRTNAINGLLVFNYSEDEFCIDLGSLIEVKNVDDVKIKVKKNREAVILLDEKEYKVIQLHKILGYLDLTTSAKSRIIFIDIFDKKIAFAVERINEILATEFLFIEDNLSMEFNSFKKYIKSVIKFQGRNLFTPDFEKICKDLNQLATISKISGSSGDYPFTKGRNF